MVAQTAARGRASLAPAPQPAWRSASRRPRERLHRLPGALCVSVDEVGHRLEIAPRDLQRAAEQLRVLAHRRRHSRAVRFQSIEQLRKPQLLHRMHRLGEPAAQVEPPGGEGRATAQFIEHVRAVTR